MIKSILICVFTLILYSPHLLIAQGDFYSGSKCENSVKFLEDNCFTCDNEINARKCKVEEFKYLGEVNNHFYYSSIYLDYHPESGNDLDKEFNVRMIAIFEGTNKERVKPVYSTGGGFGAVEHTYTELVSTKDYSIIHIGISDGNGGFDNGEFFIFKNNAWYRLTVPDLDSEFEDVIPKNCNFNSRGGWIDLKNLTFNRSVYKENEPSCCPTGGKLIAYLKLTSDNKLLVTKKEYFPNLN
jgi:hypothetical protein